VIFFSASLISAQSLVEVAKKEKARRAALRAQGKISIVVTNADLKKRYKPPVVSAKSASPTPQRNIRPTPNPPPRPSKRRTPQQAEQQRDQSSDGYMNRKFATKVLPSSKLVKNSEFALKKPDDKFAEVSILGMLELEVSVKNGPGNDIAVYARLSAIEDVMSGDEDEGGIPDSYGFDPNVGFWYGILVLDKNGNWEAIGRGTGKGVSDKFDLGSVSSAKKIRIVLKPLKDNTLPVKYSRTNSRELTCGIDAVEVLH